MCHKELELARQAIAFLDHRCHDPGCGAGILHKHWHCFECSASGYCQLTYCHRLVADEVAGLVLSAV